MSPLVSVVIPTYNHADFLKLSLASVVNQTYSNWEAIIIDNHSDDNTDEIVSSFRDSRIRLTKIKNNGVISASRNMGIREAKGDWISFLDSDDLWFPNKLERMVFEIGKLKGEIDVLCNDEHMVRINTKEKTILKYGPFEDDFYRKMLFYGNRLSTSATTIRKSFLKEKELLFSENPEFVTVEDYDFWLRLAKAKAKFLFIPEVLGEYTIHGSNQSASLERHLNHLENLIRYHVFHLQDFEKDKERLWRKFQTKLAFDEAFIRFREKKVVFAVFLIFRTFFGSPSIFWSLMIAKLNSKF
ncbi:glycosyltransferase [Leptospira santarosai]|uniref:glycosyltransferase n=1 Tax=Leptospira santarosai TaxID=28183 RepID=UPI000773B589|nr:glycosyltransferase [Leptospira santarosai]MDI7187862.1 glycosyltransferase [Leptospira santarosai]MDI7189600.1 glycosyltransferase [Leptospira santarosai]MDI7201597.1 glycosyltransferase [Leptospira santarosai]MDI7207053.1 glycosyltransferase [Leptospira santarosai]MDI7211537.1 glycosyltransferase [Leptospira santarosai]